MKKASDEGPSNRPLLVSEIAHAFDDEGLEEVDVSEESWSLEEVAELKEPRSLEEVVQSIDPQSTVEVPHLKHIRSETDELFSDDEEFSVNVSSVVHQTKSSKNSRKHTKRELHSTLCFSDIVLPHIPQAECLCLVARSLNLLDDFEIVGGIPSVVIKSKKDKEDFDGFVFSLDGSRMAVSCIQGIVKVYDAFNSFSFVGEYKLDNPIKFLDFWNRRNDILVVVTWDRKVHLVSIRDMRYDGQDTIQDDGLHKKLVIEQELEAPHPDDRSNFRSIEVAHNGSTMWIVERDLCQDRALLLTQFTQLSEIKQLRIYAGFETWPKSIHLSISKGVIAAVIVEKAHGTFKTRIFEDIDFAMRDMNLEPDELDGICVYLSNDGEEMAFWRVDKNGLHLIDVYHHEWNDWVDETALKLCCSTELSFDLMAVQVEPLNRFTTPFKKGTEIMDEMFPLLSLMAIKSNGVNLIVLDCGYGKIVKEIDLAFQKIVLNHPSDVSIRISNNMKWVSVCFLKHRACGLFSFASGSLIWTLQLESNPKNCMTQDSLQFDSLSCILIVASIGSLSALYPPCLADKDEIDRTGQSYKFLSNYEMFSTLKLSDEKISKPFMFRACENFYQKGFLDVASSFSSSRVAIVFYLRNHINIFILSSFTDIFSQHFKEWVYNREVIRRPDICLKVGAVKNWEVDDPHAAHLFFCPSHEKKGRNHIVIFYIANGIDVVLLEERDIEEQVSVSFDERDNYWLGLRQSEDGILFTCLERETIWIINLDQRSIVKKVEYQSSLVQWIKSFKFSCFHCFDQRKLDEYFEDDASDATVYSEIVEMFKNYGLCDISEDGTSTLLGWNCQSRERVIVDSKMKTEDIERMEYNPKQIVPCWSLTNDLNQVAFMRLEENGFVNEVCIYKQAGEVQRSMCKGEWNEGQRIALINVTARDIDGFNFQLDKENGHLVIQKLKALNLDIVCFTPYSLKDCVPSLLLREFIEGNQIHDDLEECIAKFGTSFLNMPFNGKSNLQVALENCIRDMTSRVLDVSTRDKILMSIVKSESLENKDAIAIDEECHQPKRRRSNLFPFKCDPSRRHIAS